MAAQAETKTGPGKIALLICLILVAAQLAFFIGWIWLEEDRSGTEIRVALAPVDPRDLLRGQYLNLAYAFDRPDRYELGNVEKSPPKPGAAVYAVLAGDASGRYDPIAYAADPDNLARVVADYRRDVPVVILGRVRPDGRGFDFGVNRYFVPEGSEEPSASETEAVLLVPRDRKPRIARLLVNGEAWEPRPDGRSQR